MDTKSITTTTTNIKDYCDEMVTIYYNLHDHRRVFAYARMSDIADALKDNAVLAFVDWCDLIHGEPFVSCYEDVLNQFKDIWPFIGWGS
jgi:hypothetical protein